LSTSLGGFLYYISIKKATFEKVQIEDGKIVEDIVNLIDLTINKHKACVKALAEFDEIQVVLRNKDAVSLTKVNSVLDLFEESFNFSAGYLMDSNGNTIASSNRKATESFVGKNYSFRPYFGEAISGLTSTYMALGITSKKRGIYLSHPVYGKDQTSPSGVVVVKSLNPKPRNLVQSSGMHSDGEIAWKISNGRGAMPA
jgi:C4-dicarboxylate-specific signal transduction histidine kinase